MKAYPMKSSGLLLLCIPLFAWSVVCAAAEQSSVAADIATATTPLPDVLKNGAAVVRLDAVGKPIAIRAGTNGMVCIADAPGDKDFDARCYNQDFIPVVYRSFQLRRQPGAHVRVGAAIEAEIKAGKLKLPDRPTAGYRCDGPASGYDAANHSIGPAIYCWQSIHFPYRTAAEMGLPDESQLTPAQQKQLPYVMSGGRYWAHVMIEHSDGH
jgi:hypothetical protein